MMEVRVGKGKGKVGRGYSIFKAISIPLFSFCHDVRSASSLRTRISVFFYDFSLQFLSVSSSIFLLVSNFVADK